MKKILIITLIAFLFIPLFLVAQTSLKNEITFIELNKQAGYVIDSLENKKCNCITYVDKKYFRHAALIQLADSHVVLRIKRINTDGYTDVPMTEATVSELHASASILNSTESSSANEDSVLKAMAGAGVGFHLARYDQLKFPDYIKREMQVTVAEQQPQNNNLIFFNAGIGFGEFHREWGDLALGLEFGYVFKKNIITLRNFKVTETEPLLGDVLPRENISDFGLLFGRTLDGGRVLLAASAGISYTRGLVRGDFLSSSGGGTWGIGSTSNYEEITFSTIGFPIQCELFIGARRDINISIIGFCNLNAKHNFGGFLICFRIGAVKQKS